MKTILVDAVGTFVVDGRINEYLLELLEQFPNRKIILTNANDEQLEAFGLVDLPYELFTLKHNPDKIDPQYFLTMLENYNLIPADCVYFEHSKEAVESAKSVGIPSYYYDAEEKDLIALEAFLKENL